MARKTEPERQDGVEAAHLPGTRDLPPVARSASGSPSVSPSSARGPWLGAAAALVLLTVTAVSLLSQNATLRRAMRDDEWRDAAQIVREGYLYGDIIRVEPTWADAPRVFLEGATFDLTPQPRSDILDGYSRVWVIAGFERGDQVEAAMPDTYELQERRRIGRVDVLRFGIPPTSRPLYVFADHLRDATVDRTYATRPTEECRLWREDAWQCGRVDKYLHVGVEMRDMDNEPRHCIYMPPVPDNGWVELTFPAVPLRDAITGRVGMDNWAVRSERGSATDFEVLINGELSLQRALDPHDPAFDAFEVDTRKHRGSQASVTFRVHASDFFDRFLCFVAQVPAS